MFIGIRFRLVDILFCIDIRICFRLILTEFRSYDFGLMIFLLGLFIWVKGLVFLRWAYLIGRLKLFNLGLLFSFGPALICG